MNERGEYESIPASVEDTEHVRGSRVERGFGDSQEESTGDETAEVLD